MEKHLSDYAEDLYNPPSYNDIVGQGILLWNINYSVALKLLKKHPDWISIKLEDLNNTPIALRKSIQNHNHFPKQL